MRVVAGGALVSQLVSRAPAPDGRGTGAGEPRPLCKYGDRCYQIHLPKHIKHLRMFRHPHLEDGTSTEVREMAGLLLKAGSLNMVVRLNHSTP